jgi:large repetitive protein
VTVRGHDELAGELTADQSGERPAGERRAAARR